MPSVTERSPAAERVWAIYDAATALTARATVVAERAQALRHAVHTTGAVPHATAVAELEQHALELGITAAHLRWLTTATDEQITQMVQDREATPA